MPQDERGQVEATSDTCPIDRRALLLGSAAVVAAIQETPASSLIKREPKWRNAPVTDTVRERLERALADHWQAMERDGLTMPLVDGPGLSYWLIEG